MFFSCVQLSTTSSIGRTSINTRRRSNQTVPLYATGSSDKWDSWDSGEERNRERALDSKWLQKPGSVFEGSSGDRTARGGRGEGWYDSALIPVVDVSANCVRPNERDTAATVEVRFFPPFYFFISYFLLKVQEHRRSLGGTEISVSAGSRNSSHLLAQMQEVCPPIITSTTPVMST